MRTTMMKTATCGTWLLFFALPLLIGGCIISPFEADCPIESPSDTCLERAGCGFCCRDQACAGGQCIAGSSLGPDDPEACEDALWRFDDIDEPPMALGCGAFSGEELDCPYQYCDECWLNDGCYDKGDLPHWCDNDCDDFVSPDECAAPGLGVCLWRGTTGNCCDISDYDCP